MLRNEMNFELLVDFASIGRPVLVTFQAAVLNRAAKAHNNYASLLPDHLPEVASGVDERALGGDVGWVLWVIVSLERQTTV